MTEPLTLRDLGWSPGFQAQLEIDELGRVDPLRVAVVHRGAAELIGPDGPRRIETAAAGRPVAVGDWALLDRERGTLLRLLEPKTLLQRRAAGTGREVQPIAANVDTLLLVSSCNADFNIARLERYLALARQAGVTPVVVLTKADAAADPDAYLAQAARLSPTLVAEAIDARNPAQVARLLPWCGRGETVAVVGSSGVGKSTLINGLTGAGQVTQGIREDDAHGRHTTTARSLHRLPSGGWLIDTPGMRALRLYDVADGVDAVFEDISERATACRFADCAHEAEPGCAVRAAIAAGELDPARLERWRKLRREDERNTASIAEQRRRARSLGRLYRSVQAEKRDAKGG